MLLKYGLNARRGRHVRHKFRTFSLYRSTRQRRSLQGVIKGRGISWCLDIATRCHYFTEVRVHGIVVN